MASRTTSARNPLLQTTCPKNEEGAKAPSQTPNAILQAEARATSALAGLQPRVLLVDHVNATAAAHHYAVLVTDLGGLQ
jgi:hypothetical protein